MRPRPGGRSASSSATGTCAATRSGPSRRRQPASSSGASARGSRKGGRTSRSAGPSTVRAGGAATRPRRRAPPPTGCTERSGPTTSCTSSTSRTSARSEWPRTLRSLERDRPLGDFDVVAFSLSFEADYVHVLDCLGLAGIPLWRRERGADGPLVIAGGPATFLNPEPLAEFVDLFLIGEAEDMLGEFLARATAEPFSREGVLERSEEVRGAYRPDRYTPAYDAAGDLVAFPYRGPGSGRVERRFVADLDRFDTNSEVLTRESVFGDMYLVEASRGCEWGCRFCAAGFMYRPVRYRSPDTLRASIARGLAERDTIGLVGAEMASLPGVAALCQEVAARGGRPRPRRSRPT